MIYKIIKYIRGLLGNFGDKVKYYKPETCNISNKCKIGEGTVIHSHVSIHDLVTIGKNCKIEAYVFIPNGVTIEDNVFVGPHVCFTNDKDLTEPFKISPTLVKQGAKIGAGAVIRAGTVIGENTIIGMGSIVLNNIPRGETWVGNPARRIK